MKRMVARWEAHEQRFEYWHPYLWRILDGYEFRPHPDHRRSIDPPPIDPPPHSGGSGNGPHGGGGDGGGGSPGVQPRGGGGTPGAIPEPGSIVLLISGFSLVALGRILKRM
jgi:hypothetical protein